MTEPLPSIYKLPNFWLACEPQDIAIRVVENGPSVVTAVEAIVREAAAFIGAPP